MPRPLGKGDDVIVGGLILALDAQMVDPFLVRHGLNDPRHCSRPGLDAPRLVLVVWVGLDIRPRVHKENQAPVGIEYSPHWVAPVYEATYVMRCLKSLRLGRNVAQGIDRAKRLNCL